MSRPVLDPDCCLECGDDYGKAKLHAGVCDGCRNEADGLCRCGNLPEPGFEMCGPCMEDAHGDYLFHSLHEEGLL